MRKHLNIIFGSIILVFFASVFLAYPIEANRVSGFCDTIESGTDINEVIEKARGIFGFDIWKKDGSAFVTIKSKFTFKTLCFIETENGLITNASFSQ